MLGHTISVQRLSLIHTNDDAVCNAVLTNGRTQCSINTISPQGLYAHPLLISYLFRDITYHLDPVLSASQPPRTDLEQTPSPHSRNPVTSCF